MNLIELMIARYTDFRKFERICNILMEREGYANIIPIGGISDEGIDAEQVCYKQSEKIIFQYSMQSEAKAKIFKTYDRLTETLGSISNLIIVTSSSVLNKQEIKTLFRKKYGSSTTLEIYDLELFVVRLSSDQLLVNEFFPSIQKQIESDYFKQKNEVIDERREASLLKIANSTLKNHNSAKLATQQVFDTLVITCIYNNPDSTLDEIVSSMKHLHGIITTKEQISASTARLQKRKAIASNGARIRISSAEIFKIESDYERVTSDLNSLSADIISMAGSFAQKQNGPAILQRMKLNIQASLTEYFKRIAAEQVHYDSHEFDIESYASIIDILKNGLPDHESQALIYSVGDVLNNPNREQSAILATLHKITLGLQVIKADPKTRTLSGALLNQKTFILDTDFILNSLIVEGHQYQLFKKVTTCLIRYGAKLVIPEESLNEIIKHCELAQRNVNFYHDHFGAPNKTYITSEVRNAFARGFLLTSIKNPRITLESYLSNYYEQSNPAQFLKRCISQNISDEIKFITLGEVQSELIDSPPFKEFKEKILEMTKKTEKASYRSDYENEQIAHVDSLLHFYAASMNKELDNPSHKFSILTDSTRAKRCARECGIANDFYVKLLNIIYTVEQIEPYDISYNEISDLFKNPFMNYSVQSNWAGISQAISLGVNLEGVNLARLRWDLEHSFSALISSARISEDMIGAQNVTDLDSKNTTKLIDSLKQRGYKFSPIIEKMAGDLESLREKNRQLEESLATKETAEAIKLKKKEKYQRSQSRRNKNHS